MIYAIAFCLMIDPFLGVIPDCIPDAALPPPVDTDTRTVVAPITVPIAKEVDPNIETEICVQGNCRAGNGAQADDDTTSKSGYNSIPSRRFQPLRNIFRKGRR